MAVRTRTFFICATLATLMACGSDGDDDAVTVVDAPPPIDATVDAPIDAMVCNAPNMVCAGVCTDVTSDNQFCGDCETSCSGGTVCQSSSCQCVDITIPSNPSFFMPMISNQLPGAILGIGPLSSGVGVDKIRWLKPVRPGDLLRVRAEILSMRPLHSRPGQGLLVAGITTLVGDTPVASMETTMMVPRRGHE